MTTLDSAQPEKKLNIPPWVVSVIVLAALAVGGWLVWWYVFGGSGPRQHMVTIEDADSRLNTPGRQNGMNFAVRRPVGNVRTTRDGWSVGGMTCVLYVQKQGAGYKFDFVPTNYSFIPKDTLLMLRIRRDLTNNLVPRDVKVTPEQIASLKKVEPLGGLTVSDADKQTMTQLWNTWNSASDGSAKVDADKKILEAVNAIATRSTEATVKTAAERGKQVSAILSVDQIEKLKTRVGP